MIRKGAVVIPARFQSSRFPGKPLADIAGRPMIQHVYDRCVDAVGKDKVYVATDDHNIKSVVQSFNGQVIMTSQDCITGTDRLAEVNENLNLDFLVNVQGDEPMVSPISISSVYDRMKEDSERVLNCYCKIEEFEVHMQSVPKVVISESGRLLYISRGACPFDKNGSSKAKYKQVCIYGFSRDHLSAFKSHPKKTCNEKIEDIEILRFLDLDFQVDMLEVDSGSVAVDTPEDLRRVNSLMNGGYYESVEKKS